MVVPGDNKKPFRQQWRVKQTSQYARAVGRCLNADRPECRPPKTAACGRSADL